MQFQVRPDDRTSTPIGGLLVRGADPETWLKAISGASLSLMHATTYAIPGQAPNTIWGCLIVSTQIDPKRFPPTVTFVSAAGNRLLIPAHSSLYPAISKQELEMLLPEGLHLLHPETGLVPLELPLSWADIIDLPAAGAARITAPAPPVFIPTTIRSFQIKAQAPEENLLRLEQRITPEKKTFDDKPLRVFEKIKLRLYRKLFQPAGSPPGKGAKGSPGALEKLAAKLGLKPHALETMKEDFESLERRNAGEVEKLLDMLKRNPEEALKYAIPLDDGSGRGNGGTFRLSRRWPGFSLLGNWGSGSGGPAAIIPETHQQKLFREYNQTAEALKEKGEYEKAAFVYLKLLRNHRQAAQALEQGKLYADAAAIHLKYTGNKLAAAECYVKANMISKAIDLFEEAGKHETVGDLYMTLSRRDEAMSAYQKVVDSRIAADHYLKAADLKSTKMGDLPAAQELLLQGWRLGRDATNCLRAYCSNIDDAGELLSSIRHIYRHETSERNEANLLAVLKKEIDRDEAIHDPLRSIAIEIIASRAPKDPSVISELRFFNKKNALILKDIMRFKMRG
jgi:tetratricopeptide (TPR) repeat protein